VVTVCFTVKTKISSSPQQKLRGKRQKVYSSSRESGQEPAMENSNAGGSRGGFKGGITAGTSAA